MTERLTVSLHECGVRRGDRWVLRGITWRLRPAERWALIGDNGSGKTQLLKLLSGDVWPTPGHRDRPGRDRPGRDRPGRDRPGRDRPGRDRPGRDRPGHDRPGREGRQYRLGRRPVELIEAKPRMAYVGAELQDKYARYGWNLCVRDLVATGLHRTDLLLRPATPAELKRVRAMLLSCGLKGLASREFLSLSYGQKRLALLARALVQDPDWLLLDEFYNGLDADYRQRINAILDAARRRGQSWVATAHRAADVPRGTGHLLELAQGRVQAVKRMRAADLEKLAARAQEKPAGRRRRAARGSAPGKGAVLIQLSRAALFVDYRPVLRDLNWQLRRGEHWAVFGANGAGKSSFLKLLYGDLSPALGGSIARRGFPAGTHIAHWKRQVGFVSPELQSDYAIDVSLLELVASGRYASIGLVDEPTARDRGAARRWLRFFGLLSVAGRRPRELSYGQLRRALIARALAADAKILLLDEPLTGLDPAQRAIMKRVLRRLMRRVTLIVAVHHAEDLPRGMTHGLRLHNRRALAIDFESAT